MRVIGRKPVLELLQSDRPVQRLMVATNAQGRIIGDIINEAKRRQVRIDRVAPQQVSKIMGGGNHQGVAADVSPVQLLSLSKLGTHAAPVEYGVIMALDSVTDPHHIGAIARSARGAGCDALLIPARRSAPITDTVIKASAGLLMQMPVIQVSNMSDALSSLKKDGWWITGAAGESGMSLYDYEWPDRVVIVMGSEGKGIGDRVRNTCDSLLRIPLENNVESLSVSAAASVLLFEAARVRIRMQNQGG